MKLVRIGSVAAAAVISAAMLAGCSTAGEGGSSDDNNNAGSSSDANTGTMCPDGEDEMFNRPEVDEGSAVTMGVDEIPHDYNNNTATANNFSNSGVTNLTQPSAFIVDGNGKVCADGDLLESVELTSEDPQTVEYTIKEDAAWSDGSPVACKDFYLAWLAAASTATITGETGEPVPSFDPAGTAGYDQMQAPECGDGPDGKTVTTTYDTPYPDWRSVFTFMVPAHVVEQAAGGVDVTTFQADTSSPELAAFAQQYLTLFAGFNPAATLSAGPFIVESASEEQLVLKRNDSYWGPKAGPESLTLKVFSDGQAMVQALQNQEIQAEHLQPDGALASQLRNLPGVVFNAYPGATYEHIDFNMALPIFQGESGDALRKAVFQCVDREDIITKLVSDVNPDTKPLGNFMYLPTEENYEDHYGDYNTADIDAAKKTMEDGGWELGSDGVYEQGGVKAEFRLGHRVVDNRAKISQLVAASCAKAGIKINDDVDQNFNAERLPASDFDAALFAWVGNPFKTASIPNYSTDGGANYNNYSNEEFDDLSKDALQELDPDALASTLNEMDKIMAEDMHSVPLYQFSDMVAQSDQLSPTLTYAGVAGGAMWNAYEWVLSS